MPSAVRQADLLLRHDSHSDCLGRISARSDEKRAAAPHPHRHRKPRQHREYTQTDPQHQVVGGSQRRVGCQQRGGGDAIDTQRKNLRFLRDSVQFHKRRHCRTRSGTGVLHQLDVLHSKLAALPQPEDQFSACLGGDCEDISCQLRRRYRRSGADAAATRRAANKSAAQPRKQLQRVSLQLFHPGGAGSDDSARDSLQHLA